ncbi:MAG: RES family NAD+ phosphorylase [Gemmatimonadetes bacterium]|nr:RES family NAD+ phosphorylase [Gemmatimonadota bacterium]
MSSSIWTRCAGDSEIRALRLEPWRAVESQHQVSTRRLVDSDAEQRLLERLIETAKPPERAPGRLHYLLFTPFRYPPLRHGSRFARRTDSGLWYGSETLRTAFAEIAYYRLLFLEGTAADLGLVETELTAFRCEVRTDRGIDLTTAPFVDHEAVLTSRESYGETQALGEAMRGAGVEAFRYTSARDIRGGVNVGVIVPAAFGRRQPRAFESWHCTASRRRVEVASRGYFGRTVHAYPREDFLVDGVLPAPAP